MGYDAGQQAVSSKSIKVVRVSHASKLNSYVRYENDLEYFNALNLRINNNYLNRSENLWN